MTITPEELERFARSWENNEEPFISHTLVDKVPTLIATIREQAAEIERLKEFVEDAFKFIPSDMQTDWLEMNGHLVEEE